MGLRDRLARAEARLPEVPRATVMPNASGHELAYAYLRREVSADDLRAAGFRGIQAATMILAAIGAREGATDVIA